CRSRPVRTDKASTARIKLIRYSEYPDRWDELYSVFSPEAISKGKVESEEGEMSKSGHSPFLLSPSPNAFLAEIEGWRDSLARNIALRNPRLGTPDNTADLNLAVQMTIDRAIFLRICEDRGIEDYGTLQNLIGKPGVYRRLMERFEDADKRYNSGLFDFRKDTVTPSLKIDDKLLSDILSELYPPKSPYEFSVIGIEILGEVYEQFLGKVIRLTAGHQAKVEEKPEVRKAGGVHYTPQYIVNYIVKNTIGRLIAGKTPAEIAKLAFLDMSCGSGSFLIGGYTCLLDYHLDWYVKHDPAKRPNEVFAIRPGEYLLTTAEKKRILLNNIYGVDIDPQAVEVTKLSLLLKVLEHENKETINQTLRLFRERALPNLDSNIKCGNSLIDSDFYRGQQGGLFDADIRRVNAFDWHKAFPQVFNRNPSSSPSKGEDRGEGDNRQSEIGNREWVGGFDADIGNPPYIRVQALNEWAPLEVECYRQHYRSASRGTCDIGFAIPPLA
ncbi:MAG: N-6 DNA methylase, partial [candidate division WOR-3 bacterium]|nr:N-6 DNA methylase [candidate division WOR-3 bacterium]